MSESKIILPELISADQFGERKNVSGTAVKMRIKSGEIETIPLGKFNFIEWERFKHIEFPHAERYKSKRRAQRIETVIND